ncbi:hypothetical protein [Runella aurantiaca]|uniref:Uncharacterized protein n=1 Tax=Runella aurantiaca TaxID=2282308 RepID=A0A369I4R2_9BACT|nr:hypothetical protein [Runella aurantiaca]RDB03245.1 hypothetical protein DVG78_24735 [Runella aurantiaca]
MKQWLKVGMWLGIAAMTGCDLILPKAERTKDNQATTGKCLPDQPVSFLEETNTERGFYNPKDSLYYGTIVYGVFYRGGITNPCELVKRPFSYKNVISRKFKVVWEGPKGVTSDRQATRALIRFTDKGYQDDIDRDLPKPDTLYPFPYEITVKEDSGYVTLPTAREYKLALRKGYSGLLNEVKCAEVSLSTTPTFDTQRIILENAATASWSPRIIFKAADFAPNVEYIVVREKECATCDVPTPTLTASTTTVGKGEETILYFSGCPVVDGAQGPLEWFSQTDGNAKELVQRFSYSARNERRFYPQVTTTYYLRCQGDWFCKPQKEVSIRIEVK